MRNAVKAQESGKVPVRSQRLNRFSDVVNHLNSMKQRRRGLVSL